jgi:RNA polymerase sigma-70 factor (ECF subfamily)
MSPKWYAPEGRFPTTHWSSVARAGQDDPEIRRDALGRLLTRYLPALQAHLTGDKGLAPEDAEDLCQEFVASKVLQKDLIARADRNLGRFRTFLLKALDRFLFNWVRDQRAKKRAPSDGIIVSAGDRVEDLAAQRGPSTAFDVAWARGVVHEALRRMQAECEASGRPEVWAVFEGRVIAPLFEGASPLDYPELVRRFGFRSPTQASNVLVTAKRTYARHLRAVVGEYASDGQEIEAELCELRASLLYCHGNASLP